SISEATDIMKDVSRKDVDTSDKLTKENNIKVTDFGVDILKNSFGEDDNTLISPISVIYALGMTANGADGNTLSEMEDTFGLSVDELNGYLNAYLKTLASSEGAKFNIANSIWIREDENLKPSEDFLQKNKDYLDAKIFEAKFNIDTAKEINNWVSDNTSGLIDSIIDEISDDAMMYLINALALTAEWESPYSEDQVIEDDFTKIYNEKEKTEFMFSKLNSYIEGENETGFLKYYKDRKYAFAALLPNEDININDYVKSLNGEKVNSLLSEVEDKETLTTIPKFESEFSYILNDSLKSMGIKKAFSPEESEFSKMGADLFISSIIHKTYISVHELGTEAGAVTAVIMEATSMPMEEPKEVFLNRPFVYMIIDTENNVPLFLGTYNGK
ncbi:MAG: serine protease, partial [Tissierellia bacterium]|nr:serine protease [Tissierellia bacterium]